MSQSQYPASQPDSWDTAPLPKVTDQKRSANLKYLWQGLGLVAIAVVSGVLWYLLNVDTPSAQQGSNQGKYAFRSVRGPMLDSDCAANAYGDVADYFAQHPCRQLSRSLYVSTPGGGRKVLSSVASVLMPDVAQATALKKLTDTDDTGNVTDLVRAGTSVRGAPGSLAGGGYASTRRGAVVVIVESDYLGKGSRGDEKLLGQVSQDAVRLGFQ